QFGRARNAIRNRADPSDLGPAPGSRGLLELARSCRLARTPGRFAVWRHTVDAALAAHTPGPAGPVRPACQPELRPALPAAACVLRTLTGRARRRRRLFPAALPSTARPINTRALARLRWAGQRATS